MDEANTDALQDMAFVDIETVPDAELEDSFPPIDVVEPRPEQQVPSTWSVEELLDPRMNTADTVVTRLRQLNPPEDFLKMVEKAEQERPKPRKTILEGIESIRRTKAQAADAVTRHVKIRSLCPETLRIAAIGIAHAQLDPVVNVAGPSPGPLDWTEKQLLRWFWNQVSGNRVVGFYCLAFDLPAIIARSALLGIKPMRHFDLSPYGNTDVVDLYFRRFGRASVPKDHPSGLKDLAKCYGIGVPVTDYDGSCVYADWIKSDLDRIRRYCASDVAITRELFIKWKGYWT